MFTNAVIAGMSFRFKVDVFTRTICLRVNKVSKEQREFYDASSSTVRVF